MEDDAGEGGVFRSAWGTSTSTFLFAISPLFHTLSLGIPPPPHPNRSLSTPFSVSFHPTRFLSCLLYLNQSTKGGSSLAVELPPPHHPFNYQVSLFAKSLGNISPFAFPRYISTPPPPHHTLYTTLSHLFHSPQSFLRSSIFILISLARPYSLRRSYLGRGLTINLCETDCKISSPIVLLVGPLMRYLTKNLKRC